MHFTVTEIISAAQFVRQPFQINAAKIAGAPGVPLVELRVVECRSERSATCV